MLFGSTMDVLLICRGDARCERACEWCAQVMPLNAIAQTFGGFFLLLRFFFLLDRSFIRFGSFFFSSVACVCMRHINAVNLKARLE